MTNVIPLITHRAEDPVVSYAEASYFDGYAFQHIADWQEENRLRRIRERHRVAIDRRRGSRSFRV